MIPSDEAFRAPWPSGRPFADPPGAPPPDPNEAFTACEDELIIPWTRPGAPAPGPSDDHDGLAERALPVATFILAILLVLGDCSGSTVAPDQETVPVPMTESHTPLRTHTDTTPLDLRLEAPSRARSGVPVPLRLVLSNPTSRPITVDLGGMPTAFDFVVHTADGVEIWRRLEGTTIRDVLTPRTVEPGGSIRYTATWPQRDDEGRPVRPGLYRVVGILPLDGVPGGQVTGGHTLEIAADFDASRPRPPISMAETRDSGARRPDSPRRRTFLLHSTGSFVFQRHNVPKITLDIPLTGRYCR